MILNPRLTIEQARALMSGRARKPPKARVPPSSKRDFFGVEVTLELPIEVISINNVYGWKRSRSTCRKWVLSYGGDLQHVRKPAAVGLIRIAPGKFDGDNLQPSFKFIRDAIAEVYGVDDADWKKGAISWSYSQMSMGRLYGVRIVVVGDLI